MDTNDAPKKFDISLFELEDTATLTVQNAKGDGDLIGEDGINPVTIELYGGGSREATKALHKAGLQAQARLQRVLRGKIDQKDALRADEEMVAKLATCTKKVNNFPIDPKELYANPKLGYITRQVMRFLDDDANFAKPSSTP